MSDGTTSRRALAIAVAAVTVAITMLVLDLTWLGVVARGVYDTALGPLKRLEVHRLAAALFYAMYVSAVVVHAVLGARGVLDGLRRGAALGAVAYSTYELTNWAVIRDWPAVLVPLDIGWGVVLTAVAGGLGRVAYDRVLGASAS